MHVCQGNKTLILEKFSMSEPSVNTVLTGTQKKCFFRNVKPRIFNL